MQNILFWFFFAKLNALKYALFCEEAYFWAKLTFIILEITNLHRWSLLETNFKCIQTNWCQKTQFVKKYAFTYWLYFIISNLFPDATSKKWFFYLSAIFRKMRCPTNVYIVHTPPYQLCISYTPNTSWLCIKRRKSQPRNVVESW